MGYEQEVVKWCDKHNTIPEVTWAISQAHGCINTLKNNIYANDPYELAVWQARLPILKAKALLLGITTE